MAGPPRETQSKFLVHPLSYVRAERSWSLQDVANLVSANLNTANRREKVWRWENWGVVPDKDTQYALAVELGIQRGYVDLMGWPGWLPIGQRIDYDLPWTVENGIALLDQVAGKAMADRRGFMILAAGAASAMARSWLYADCPEIAHTAQGARIDGGVVDLLEGRLPGLRSMDYALGGESVRMLVDAELAVVNDILKRCSYDQDAGRRLFAIAAELGRIAGWASFDAGYQAAAERYWVAALRAAHSAADRGLGANILKSMSLQRVDTARPKEALELAQAALHGAKSEPARVRAMLTTRQARTHAFLSDRRACEQLLIIAEKAMARADDEHAPSWARYFDKPEYCAQVAACYLMLERHEAAESWLVQALESQPAERRRDRATYLIWQADAVDHMGDVDRSCKLVREAIPDVTGAPSARNRQRLTDIDKQLFARGTPATVDLHEEVRAALAVMD